MNKGWTLTASLEKKNINENGEPADVPCFICMDEADALKEARKRAKKYLENGNTPPQGNRFFLLSPDGKMSVCFHNVQLFI